MDERCILCDHPKVGHFGSGCHRTSFLRGGCDCDFVEPAPLPLSATADQHRDRAAWWTRRIDMTDNRMWHVTHGSPQWQRLDRMRKVADAARHHHLEMAQALPPEPETDAETEREDEGDDLLDLISIESIVRQPTGTLDLMLGLFDRSPDAGRDQVRARLETEFDQLEPRHRRALMEDVAIRGAFEHMGVVTHFRPSITRPSEEAPAPEDDRIPDTIGRAMEGTLVGPDLQEALESEFSETLGDEAWAETESDGGQHPRDEDLLSRYRYMRSQLEAYWRHWADAPSPAVQRELVTRHPAAFRRQMVLAVQVLTPPEKARFGHRAELLGWIASGMLPLFVEGDAIPLPDIVEARYLACVDR
jgi:hypothetical protein